MGRIKKYLTGFMLATATIGLLAGCGNEGAPANDTGGGGDDELLIYGIYKAGDQTWFIDEGNAARAQTEEMGGSFVFVDAEMSSEVVLTAIDNAIANNASGVLICIPDQVMSQVVVDRLTEAGIPVIAVDDPLIDDAGEKIAPWVGIDGYTIGYANGQWLAEYILEHGIENLEGLGVMLLTMDTVSSTVPRIDGAVDAFLNVLPNFDQSLFFRADHDGTTERGNVQATAVITANPQITHWMILSANEEAAIGAVRALETAGIDQNAAVVGLGGYLAYDEWLRNPDVAMRSAAFFSAEDIGRTSARFLIEYIRYGTEVPWETAISATMVTPDNFREIMGD